MNNKPILNSFIYFKVYFRIDYYPIKFYKKTTILVATSLVIQSSLNHFSNYKN